MAKSKSRTNYGVSVPAVEQACRILICLSRNSATPLNLISISKQVGIHNSKGYSILNTLMRFGLVQKDPLAKTYRLGPGLAHLGRKALEGLDLRDLVSPYLKDLAEKTGETCLFGLLSAEQVFIIVKEPGKQLIGVNVDVGDRFHMTAGAHGKAIVAKMRPEGRKKILSRKRLYFYGDPSRFDKGRLEAELSETERTGFAVDLGELQHGVNAVSSAVMDGNGSVVGCVIVVGTFPQEKVALFGPAVADAAEEISKALGFDGEPNCREV